MCWRKMECRTCHKKKKLILFTRNNRSCKKCVYQKRKPYFQAYQKKHRERFNAYARKYYRDRHPIVKRTVSRQKPIKQKEPFKPPMTITLVLKI